MYLAIASASVTLCHVLWQSCPLVCKLGVKPWIKLTTRFFTLLSWLLNANILLGGQVVDANNHILCPDCHTLINVGKVSIQNYKTQHKNSEKCKENLKNYRLQRDLDKSRTLARNFFKPRAPLVPATVVAPPTVHSTPLPSLKPAPAPLNAFHPPPSGCPIAVKLLSNFRTRIEQLPHDVGEAENDHPLAWFSSDPTGCVDDSSSTLPNWRRCSTWITGNDSTPHTQV